MDAAISNPGTRRAKLIFLALVLALTAAVFHPVGGYAFLNWDDDIYVQNNPHLRDGFSAKSVEWAFTANLTHFSQYAEYWAPITLLTRIADAQLFGINAGPMHWTSVCLHALNAVLLAFALHALTGAWWRSAVVALLFLVHPQNVEPALWLSARKDLVAATFLFLTLLAYARHARNPGRGTYALLLASFVGALMAKPMAVSVPLLLLLLDFWPLNRWKPGNRQANIQLLAEKLPLVVLAALAAWLAVQAQVDVGAMSSYPWGVRISNAIYATATYLRRAVWPDDLCIFYPHTEGTLSTAIIAGCLVTSLVVTALALWQMRKRPVIAFGWLWFLIGLGPVIGLVQVGRQAMADRYFYTTGIGLFVAAVWVAAEWIRKGRTQQQESKIPAVLAVVCVGALAVVTARQVGFWRDSGAAFERAIAVTQRNYIAHGNLGTHYRVTGDLAKSKAHIMESLSINPYQFTAWNNLGSVEVAMGRIPAAIHAYERAVLLDPNSARASFHLGRLLLESGRKAEALPLLKRARELAPNWPEPARVLSEIGEEN